MITRKVTSAEEKRAMQVYYISFEQIDRSPVEQESSPAANPDDFAARERQSGWPTADRYASFTDEGDMMAVTTVWHLQSRFDGHTVEMRGIGGVATLPVYRKMGAQSAVIRKFLVDMYEEGVPFSYLFPFSTVYYGRYGYACCGTRVRWTLDLNVLRTVEDEGSMTLYDGSEEDLQGIREVYEKYAENLNMSVVRSAVKYKQFRQKTPHRDGYYTYLYKNKNGEPVGVMAFSKKYENNRAIMDCDCFWFTDKHVLLRMLNFAKGFQPFYHQIRFSLPGHMDIHNLVPEWSICNNNYSSRHMGMGRVVNVQSVLEMARYRGSGTLVLKITDPTIQPNEGVYVVEYANGKAVKVSRDENAAPDATLTINTFSTLILGGGESTDTVDFTEWRDGMVVHNPNAPFGDIFYQKPLYIMDSF